MAKYALVIVETRELPNLCAIIDNHLDYVPKDWDLVVFGSSLNKETIKKNYPNAIFNDLVDININSSYYNRLLTSIQFWDYLQPYDRVLIFQHDSKLLRNGIENFIHYDYVGAPWKHIHLKGGNGGLSIRNPYVMKYVCENFNYNESVDGNEDIYFCKHINGWANVAGMEDACKFSVETMFYPTPIGCHAPEKYLNEFELNILYGNN